MISCLQWHGHLRSNCFFFILASSGCALAPTSHSDNQCVARGTGPWPMAGPLTKSAWPSCYLQCRRTQPTSNSQQTDRRSTWSHTNVVSTWTPNTFPRWKVSKNPKQSLVPVPLVSKWPPYWPHRPCSPARRACWISRGLLGGLQLGHRCPRAHALSRQLAIAGPSRNCDRGTLHRHGSEGQRSDPRFPKFSMRLWHWATASLHCLQCIVQAARHAAWSATRIHVVWSLFPWWSPAKWQCRRWSWPHCIDAGHQKKFQIFQIQLCSCIALTCKVQCHRSPEVLASALVAFACWPSSLKQHVLGPSGKASAIVWHHPQISLQLSGTSQYRQPHVHLVAPTTPHPLADQQSCQQQLQWFCCAIETQVASAPATRFLVQGHVGVWANCCTLRQHRASVDGHLRDSRPTLYCTWAGQVDHVCKSVLVLVVVLLVSLHIPGVAVYHIKHMNTVHKGNGIIICIYRMPWIYHTGVVTIYGHRQNYGK